MSPADADRLEGARPPPLARRPLSPAAPPVSASHSAGPSPSLRLQGPARCPRPQTSVPGLWAEFRQVTPRPGRPRHRHLPPTQPIQCSTPLRGGDTLTQDRSVGPDRPAGPSPAQLSPPTPCLGLRCCPGPRLTLPLHLEPCPRPGHQQHLRGSLRLLLAPSPVLARLGRSACGTGPGASGTTPDFRAGLRHPGAPAPAAPRSRRASATPECVGILRSARPTVWATAPCQGCLSLHLRLTHVALLTTALPAGPYTRICHTVTRFWVPRQHSRPASACSTPAEPRGRRPVPGSPTRHEALPEQLHCHRQAEGQRGRGPPCLLCSRQQAWHRQETQPTRVGSRSRPAAGRGLQARRTSRALRPRPWCRPAASS